MNSLFLGSVAFDDYKDIYTRAIDFGFLKSLELSECFGIDKLLTTLATQPSCRVSSLTSFSLREGYFDVTSIEAFLLSCSGLISLSIETLETLPCVMSIVNHARTLKHLHLISNRTLNPPTIYSLEDIKVLFSECSELEGLALELPSVQLGYSPLTLPRVSKEEIFVSEGEEFTSKDKEFVEYWVSLQSQPIHHLQEHKP